MQGVGVHAAGENFAGVGLDGVIGAGQSGDGVEQDHHVVLVFDHALGLLDDHLGHLDVPLGGLVEGGTDHGQDARRRTPRRCQPGGRGLSCADRHAVHLAPGGQHLPGGVAGWLDRDHGDRRSELTQRRTPAGEVADSGDGGRQALTRLL
mgnify:CR=1 FL=1